MGRTIGKQLVLLTAAMAVSPYQAESKLNSFVIQRNANVAPVLFALNPVTTKCQPGIEARRSHDLRSGFVHAAGDVLFELK